MFPGRKHSFFGGGGGGGMAQQWKVLAVQTRDYELKPQNPLKSKTNKETQPPKIKTKNTNGHSQTWACNVRAEKGCKVRITGLPGHQMSSRFRKTLTQPNKAEKIEQDTQHPPLGPLHTYPRTHSRTQTANLNINIWMKTNKNTCLWCKAISWNKYSTLPTQAEHKWAKEQPEILFSFLSICLWTRNKKKKKSKEPPQTSSWSISQWDYWLLWKRKASDPQRNQCWYGCNQRTL